jgi:hypothetical protein
LILAPVIFRSIVWAAASVVYENSPTGERSKCPTQKTTSRSGRRSMSAQKSSASVVFLKVRDWSYTATTWGGELWILSRNRWKFGLFATDFPLMSRSR